MAIASETQWKTLKITAEMHSCMNYELSVNAKIV